MTYKPGIYVVRLADGTLDLRCFDDGWWQDFGNPRDQTEPGGQIIAGPFSAEQIATLGADMVVCDYCEGRGFVNGYPSRIPCPTCQQRGKVPREVRSET